jgi:hypothetical protein
MTPPIAPVAPVRLPARTWSRQLYVIASLVAMTILLVAWSSITRRKLDAAILRSAAESLDRAHLVFDGLRARSVAGLLSQCRVLVEDPRLKASLATEGVDETTVSDILADILRLRRTGFLLVLSQDGRVFAEAGADELRGLDLSGSSVMSRVRGASDAVGGAWVIGGKLVDLAVTSVRFDQSVLAYLVVGQAVDAELVKAVDGATGVAIAVIAGPEPAPISTADGELRAVFHSVAAEASVRAARTIDRGGERYLAAIVELEGTPQTHPRLAMVRSLSPERKLFDPVTWLLWVPYVLVVLAAALGGLRSSVGRS